MCCYKIYYCYILDFVIWCKWIASYIFIEMVRRRSTKRFDLYDFEVENDPYKIGFLPPPQEVVLESPLSEDQLLYVSPKNVYTH